MSDIMQDMVSESPDFNSFYNGYLDRFINLLEKSRSLPLNSLLEEILKTHKNGGKIYCIGNGGCAAGAAHLANGISFITKRWDSPILANSLVSDSVVLTSIANDWGFEEVFSRQLEVFWKKEDLLIGLTTSGNSKNLIRAFEFVRNKGGRSIGITGHHGGAIKELCDLWLNVETSEVMQGPIEDTIMSIGHALIYYLEFSKISAR